MAISHCCQVRNQEGTIGAALLSNFELQILNC